MVVEVHVNTYIVLESKFCGCLHMVAVIPMKPGF